MSLPRTMNIYLVQVGLLQRQLHRKTRRNFKSDFSMITRPNIIVIAVLLKYRFFLAAVAGPLMHSSSIYAIVPRNADI